MASTLPGGSLDWLRSSQSPLLAALPIEARTELARRMYPRRCAPGEVIIRQGSASRDLYLLAEGEATVRQSTAQNDQVTVGRLEPGDLFGEWSLLTHRPRAATVQAVTEVLAYVLHEQDYDTVLESYLSLTQYLRRAISIRQREYAGLVAAEVNVWSAALGGFGKDQILTAAFLAVAVEPSAPLSLLALWARWRVWLAAVASSTADTNDLAAVAAFLTGGTGVAQEARLARGLNDLLRELATYPAFRGWEGRFIELLTEGVRLLASSPKDDREQVDRLLVQAYLATIHIGLLGSGDGLDERLQALDEAAADAVMRARALQLRVQQARADRRPGHAVPDGGAKSGRREIERRLAAIGRSARGLDHPARASALAVARFARLLSEYSLGLMEVRTSAAALPISSDL